MEDFLPYLTDDFSPIPGAIKRYPEDFFVEETPLYNPSGTGTHCFFQIEKRNIATPQVINKIARALKISRRNIGYAGLKDAHAVTRQWLSVEHIDCNQIAALNISSIKVLRISHHENKLKIGHLRGNRFVIKIRNLEINDGDSLDNQTKIVSKIMTVLAQKGVPNYYGQQRFGKRGDTHRIGAAIVVGDAQRFADLFLGSPSMIESKTVREARQYYDQGEFQKALDAWPRDYHDELDAIGAIVRRKDKSAAFYAVDKKFKRFCISAFQSELFNQILARRIKTIDKLYDGEVAWKHDSGASFLVENAEIEQPRCDSFEISPTGPMYGYKMIQPIGVPARIESEVMAESGITIDDFVSDAAQKTRGARRAFRFRPENIVVSNGVDQNGSYIELQFQLPSGCYATTLIREITKNN